MSNFPYGEERTGTADGREKFGTYTRDGQGQDYAEQRYFNANMGAFWSADPGGINTADPRNPSSWNRYSYVGGDSVNFTDARGLFMAPAASGADEDDDLPEPSPWFPMPGPAAPTPRTAPMD